MDPAMLVCSLASRTCCWQAPCSRLTKAATAPWTAACAGFGRLIAAITASRRARTGHRMSWNPIFPYAVISMSAVRGVHRVTTLDLDGSDQEWEPLGELVGGAELVGLGESVHTSGGFYQAKHRVFAYLVQRHGFRALAIESSWENTEEIGRYLVTGQGDPAEVTSRGLYPVWVCAETVCLVRWMRRWNVEHPDDPVTIFGFDVQQPEADRDGLAELLRESACAEADGLVEGLARCTVAVSDGRPTKLTRKAHDANACLANLDAVDAWLDARDGQLGTDALELARLRAGGLRSWHMAGGRPGAVAGVQAREDAMAHALRVQRQRCAPGQKTVVWAHNGHLAHATHRVGSRGYWMGAVRGMGTLLREELGERYRAVALTGYQVATRWPGKAFAPNDGPDRRSHSFDHRLHELGIPYLIIDPVAAPPRPALFGRARREWFGRPQQARIVVCEQFAAVLYLDHSPAMTPL